MADGPEGGWFAELCRVAERNGLQVELVRNHDGMAIWVLRDERPEGFEIEGVRATMRVAVVATPFWSVPPEQGAPQLIGMLEQRGFR